MALSTRLLAVAVVLATGGLSAARAGSVPTDIQSLNTYAGSGWNVTRAPAPGSSDPTFYPTQGVQNVGINNQPVYGGPNPGIGTWANLPPESGIPGDPPPQWVAWTSDPNQNMSADAQGTWYTYTDTFTLTAASNPAALRVVSAMYMDNYIYNITLTAAHLDAHGNVLDSYIIPVSATWLNASGTASSPPPVIPKALAATVPNPFLPYVATEDGYFYQIAATAGLDPLNTPLRVTLSVYGINEDTNPRPTWSGFEATGFATVIPDTGAQNISSVPLPAAAGIGFSMLGGFGALFGIRKQLSRRARIA